MSCRRFVASITAVAWLAVCGIQGAQGQSASVQAPKGYKVFSDPAGRFALAHPSDWLLIAGARDQLLTLARRDLKAVVVVEQQHMLNPTTEITSFLMKLEAGSLKDRQPNAQDIAASPLVGRPTVMVLDYSRPGMAGPERLRQYSVYEGTTLFRVTGIASAKDFDRYQESFATIANSLKISSGAAGGGSF